jgi:hypothetical protein
LLPGARLTPVLSPWAGESGEDIRVDGELKHVQLTAFWTVRSNAAINLPITIMTGDLDTTSQVERCQQDLRSPAAALPAIDRRLGRIRGGADSVGSGF